ncbi:hypothetical protein [Flavobacterium aquiphilum]|uniref:hypothetical protein n=1 Tax=Flavobacterium aquiphilum TaxID=3003261 RepID=UPI00248137D4|nr:hypothetical protein [Flavobacterium aquiphilum]
MKNEDLVKIQSYNLDVEEYKLIDSIYTDPATVIAIAETGYKLYNMFKRKRSGPSEELKYLRKIYSDIRNMQQDLKLIINLLQDLKVYIDQRQIEFIANTLSSKINTTNLFLIGWLETGKGNIEEQFASIHETKNLLAIYGFAHIHVYMLAFQTELELCYWLEKGDNFTKALLEDSRQYFSEALNENHTLETPSKRLKFISNAISELQQKFPIGTYSQEIKITTSKATNCMSEGYKIVLYTLTIEGGIENGFSFGFSEKLIKKVDPVRDGDCRGEPGGGGVGPRLMLTEFEEKLFEINSNAPLLDKQISNYNSAHELYLKYLKSKLELTATINTVIQMVGIIDTWDK